VWWQGEDLLRTEDILNTIEKEGHSIAIIMLPGVQYYTGQILDMKTITKSGHQKVDDILHDNRHLLTYKACFLQLFSTVRLQ